MKYFNVLIISMLFVFAGCSATSEEISSDNKVSLEINNNIYEFPKEIGIYEFNRTMVLLIEDRIQYTLVYVDSEVNSEIVRVVLYVGYDMQSVEENLKSAPERAKVMYGDYLLYDLLGYSWVPEKEFEMISVSYDSKENLKNPVLDYFLNEYGYKKIN